jgi:ACS family tartrate transporter-like MFS transporter
MPATQESLSESARNALGSKILWRLGVPTILFMLVSALDRVNVSFGALQMNHDLGFTPTQYGLGAGILFAGFLTGQYPSVLLLQRIGMHRWMPACAVLWALCAIAIAFVSTPSQFYTLRVLLGFAEGGLAPGIVLYLSQFATERQRATTFALPMLAVPMSIVLGGPLSGWLMGMGHPLGLSPWRFMLIAEALPAIALGVAAWFYFPDQPADARWLTQPEREWLLANAALSQRGGKVRNDWRILKRPMVWAAALLWFALLSGAYGIMFWLPQMIKQLSGLSPVQIGVVNALPWIGAMLGTYFNSRHSDRTGERFWHVGVPAVVAAFAICAAWIAGAGPVGLAALFIAGAGLGSAQGAFWAIPASLLSRETFAVAAVAINIAGSSGGLIIPHLVGYVLEHTGSFVGPTALIAGLLLMAAVLVVSIKLMFFGRKSLLPA